MSKILDVVLELVEEDNDSGICTACYQVAYGVEPDAEGYQCGSCGELTVCGAEQFLLSTLPF